MTRRTTALFRALATAAFAMVASYACGGGDDDKKDELECGPGTVREGKTCVPVDDGGAGAAGGGAGGDSGSSGSGGDSGAAGTAGSGGSPPADAGGDASMGGSSGSGGVTSGRWLGFEKGTGAYVVDAQDLATLSAVRLGPTSGGLLWSSDGRQVAHADSTRVWAGQVDGATATPSVAVFTLTPGFFTPRISWSGDSHALALLEQTTLRFVVPGGAAPLPVSVSQQARAFAWVAPKSAISWLNGVPAANEIWVAPVTNGALGAPRKIVETTSPEEIQGAGWTADGERAAVYTSDRVLLATFDAASPSEAQEVATLTSGRHVTWYGDRFVCAVSDMFGITEELHVIDLGETPPTVTSFATLVTTVSASPDGRWVVFGSAGSALQAVSLDDPATVHDLTDPRVPVRWSKDSSRLLANVTTGMTTVFWLYDMSGASPSAGFIPFDSNAQGPEFSPTNLLTYEVDGTLWYFDMSTHPPGVAQVLLPGNAFQPIPSHRWSPAADRIALEVSNKVQIARVDGTAVSPPVDVDVGDAATGSIDGLWWQP